MRSSYQAYQMHISKSIQLLLTAHMNTHTLTALDGESWDLRCALLLRVWWFMLLTWINRPISRVILSGNQSIRTQLRVIWVLYFFSSQQTPSQIPRVISGIKIEALIKSLNHCSCRPLTARKKIIQVLSSFHLPSLFSSVSRARWNSWPGITLRQGECLVQPSTYTLLAHDRWVENEVSPDLDIHLCHMQFVRQ